jgi:hypothetical protein
MKVASIVIEEKEQNASSLGVSVPTMPSQTTVLLKKTARDHLYYYGYIQLSNTYSTCKVNPTIGTKLPYFGGRV